MRRHQKGVRPVQRKSQGPIRSFFLGIAKAITRSVAFFRKEMVEVWRRPGVLLSLVVGPFLIMALFGIGYSGYRKPLDTVMVIPANAAIPRDVDFYQKVAGQNLRIRGVTDNLESARQELGRQQIDLIVVAPSDLQTAFESGQQSVIQIIYNDTNPGSSAYARLIAQQQVQDLNRAIIEYVVAQGQSYAVQTTGNQQAAQIPPQVVAEPTRPDTQNIAPVQPSVSQFYAPAVLALVLQHMAITLSALSVVRERLSGAMDIFRVAPVRTLEILVGKYLSYGFLTLVLAAVITALLVRFLGVPMLGSIAEFGSVLLLLIFASLGLGLLISTVADSERQAVQLSMLVLLASVFLSGFVLPLEQFNAPVQWVGYLLPVTHGIRLLQDDMLRGGTNYAWEFYALAVFGVVAFFFTTITLRRNLAAD